MNTNSTSKSSLNKYKITKHRHIYSELEFIIFSNTILTFVMYCSITNMQYAHPFTTYSTCLLQRSQGRQIKFSEAATMNLCHVLLGIRLKVNKSCSKPKQQTSSFSKSFRKCYQQFRLSEAVQSFCYLIFQQRVEINSEEAVLFSVTLNLKC